MKKIISIGIVVFMLLSSFTACIGEKEEGGEETELSLSSTSIDERWTDEKDNENTRFVAERFSLFPSGNDDRIQLLNSIVTKESVYLLLSIREQAKIEEKLNEITPQMPIEQVNKIHNDVEKLYVREEIYVIDHQGEVKEKVNREVFFQDKQIPIQSMHVGVDGVFVVSKPIFNEQIGLNGNFVQKMDYQGVVSESTTFLSPSKVANRISPLYHSFVWNTDGVCYAAGEYMDGEQRNQFIDVIGTDGNILFSITEDLDAEEYMGMPNRIMIEHEDVVYTIINTENGQSEIAPILFEKQELGDRRLLDRRIGTDAFVSDGRLYQADANGLWSIRMDTLQESEVFLWDDLEIDMTAYSRVPVVFSHDRILLCGNRMAEDSTYMPEWYMLNRTKIDEEVVSKKTIVLGGVDISNNGFLRQTVNQFNRANKEYNVEIRDYMQELEAERSKYVSTMKLDGFIEAEVQLNLRLAAEGGVDIFMGKESYLRYDILANSGILADLNTLIDNDKEFQKEKYIDLMFETTHGNGELYYSFTDFRYCGIVTMKETLPDGKNGWSLREMEEYISSLPANVKPFYPVYDTWILSDLLNASFPELVDQSLKTAYFDSDYFLQILSFCRRYSAPVEDGEPDYEDLMKGNTLMRMDCGNISSINAWVGSYIMRGGENVTQMGIPTEEANHILCYPNNKFGIAAGDNEAGAWEFIKFYLSETEKSPVNELFPTNKASLDKMFQKYINSADDKGMTLVGTDTVSTGVLEEMYRVINSMTRVCNIDSLISRIVMEEAGAYFANQKSAEEVASIIQNRVQTLLNER